VFKPESGQWYEMPVMFGRSVLPPQTKYDEVRSIAHRFITEPSAVEPFVPYHFRLAEPATVTVVSNMLIGVDYLAGRNCTTVRVSVDAEYHKDGEVLRGPYGLVVWESDPAPVIAGREHLGISKLVAQVPEHERGDGTAAFECREYGSRLLRVDVRDLTPADPGREPPREAEFVTLGWKYSPGPGGTVDADYPTKMVARTTQRARWTGASAITFGRPTWEQAPISARIVAALAALPVVEVLPASMTFTAGTLDRAASARLG
jgi:Acetoacetate decarboxylase (ADC)